MVGLCWILVLPASIGCGQEGEVGKASLELTILEELVEVVKGGLTAENEKNEEPDVLRDN